MTGEWKVEATGSRRRDRMIVWRWRNWSVGCVIPGVVQLEFGGSQQILRGYNDRIAMIDGDLMDSSDKAQLGCEMRL